MQITTTPRLTLRELTVDDAQHFYELNLDPEVLQFTGDVVFETIDAARQFLENYGHYKKYGYGRWAVIRKEDGAFLGWCGLKFSEDTGECDLGFRFFKKYWNQGYATEAAKASLELGFTKFGILKIIGRAMTANLASVRILEKIGMEFSAFFDFDGEDGVLYSISKSKSEILA
ncbi:GNAT family N-acetyltransferase [Flavobacterium zepuense]|uniref:GNAT family N-acetyltransferase n=1 Tax=Flavobacterium zepuense TaxID=2593302 RepID=A0A552UT88_9FLAO|nr:GNAT family N-acetyltransferase [Flavobacterium zepuense]TRW21439.1 GNAT family N-acetyltransferase [Flavobacterium zepuense]